MTGKIFIYGDSHTVALSNAPKSENTFIKRLSDDPTTENEISYSNMLNEISTLTNHDHVIVSILGTQHNILGLLQHPDKFDIASSSMRTEDINLNNIKLIPYNCMYETFEEILNQSNVLDKIKENSICQIHHLSTPPPKGSNDFILNNSVKYRGNFLAEIGVTSPSLRKTIWQIEMTALKNYCTSKEIGFIPAPTDSLTSGGFLKEEYYQKDATHANHQYGSLVLNDLENKLLLGDW